MSKQEHIERTPNNLSWREFEWLVLGSPNIHQLYNAVCGDTWGENDLGTHIAVDEINETNDSE